MSQSKQKRTTLYLAYKFLVERAIENLGSPNEGGTNGQTHERRIMVDLLDCHVTQAGIIL